MDKQQKVILMDIDIYLKLDKVNNLLDIMQADKVINISNLIKRDRDDFISQLKSDNNKVILIKDM